jgi:Transposase, Mutator family
MKKHNKKCLVCGGRMRRHGMTKFGTERYFCPVCRKASVIHRADTSLRHHGNRFVDWLTGVQGKDAIAKKYGVTRRGLTKEFEPFFRKDPNGPSPLGFQANRLIVDAKFVHGRVLCALIAVTEEDKIFWQFAESECYRTWSSFLVGFSPPAVVVADGQKGMFHFVKKHWPGTAFQRCHFHMVLLVTHYLSRNPKEEAGQAIVKLVHELKTVKTCDDKKRWLMFHTIWEKRYLKVFQEKNASGGYAHRKLRSVRFVLRKALPNLFIYLDFPGCPNTTNLVEGWPNTAIAEGLRRHRGLHLSQKKTLVSTILSHLTREKPTRRFSTKKHT